MDQDSNRKKSSWVNNDNVKYKRVESMFNVMKSMKAKEKENYRSLIDVFNTTLASALFFEERTQMNYYYSWMQSLGNYVQSPHVDFTQEEESHGNFFNFIFPLTETGCYVYVWPAFEHKREKRIAGSLVFIAYGKGLLISSDIVHAGGISADGTHPRVGLHITRDAEHALSTSYSTRSRKLVNKKQYNFQPWYFVKPVDPKKGVNVDHYVVDVSSPVLV